MEEQQKWGRSRYIAMAAVAALHLILLVALVSAAKFRVLSPGPDLIELLVLPEHAAPSVPPPRSTPANPSKKAADAGVTSFSAITIDPSTVATDSVGAPVDWGQEARDVAAERALEVTAEPAQGSALSPPSPFAAPAPHHRGEQIPTADGQWIVFVTDSCYQVSKSITAITNATNTGMSLQTYCIRRSKTPRGDLFEQLPAYKKFHPGN
jgi:hypothetical protein